jgi:hypothetical protein
MNNKVDVHEISVQAMMSEVSISNGRGVLTVSNTSHPTLCYHSNSGGIWFECLFF